MKLLAAIVVLIVSVASIGHCWRNTAVPSKCFGREQVDQTVSAAAATEALFSCPTSQSGQFSCPTQTFTVGRDGHLSRVDVLVRRNWLTGENPTTPLQMEIRKLDWGGEPESRVHARTSVAPDRISDEAAYVAFHFTDSAPSVRKGDRLAIVLRTGSTEVLYDWCFLHGDPYAAGSMFQRETYSRFQGWKQHEQSDFVFTTFVSSVVSSVQEDGLCSDCR